MGVAAVRDPAISLSTILKEEYDHQFKADLKQNRNAGI